MYKYFPESMMTSIDSTEYLLRKIKQGVLFVCLKTRKQDVGIKENRKIRM